MIIIHACTYTKCPIWTNGTSEDSFLDWSLERMHDTLVHIVIESGVGPQLSSHHTLPFFVEVNRQNIIVVVSEQSLRVICHIVIYKHRSCMIHNNFLL